MLPYKPFRFAYKALPSAVLSCGWPTPNSWWRMGISAASFVVLASAVLFTWKERTGYMVFTIVLMLLTAAGHLLSSLLDADALRKGGTECTDGFTVRLHSHTRARTHTRTHALTLHVPAPAHLHWRRNECGVPHVAAGRPCPVELLPRPLLGTTAAAVPACAATHTTPRY